MRASSRYGSKERRFAVGSSVQALRCSGVRVFGCSVLALALFVAPVPSPAAETIVIKADRVITVSGPAIQNGTVLVQDGKITAVGKSVAVPANARVIRAAVAMPGLVDSHTHIGCQNEIEEPIDALMPDLRACDAFDPDSASLRKALAAGVTTVGLAPGNGNVVGGKMAVVRLGKRPAVISGYAAQKLSISLDAANDLRNPTSRGGVIALARRALAGAGRATAVSSSRQTSLLVGEFPTRLSERATSLAPVLHGKVPVFIHAPETVDVEAALRLSSEFGLRPVLVHSSGGARVGGLLKSRGVPVVLGALGLASTNRLLEAPAKLARAGVKVAFCTDGPASDPGSLRMSAHLAVKHGMSPDVAIRALTLSGAEALGIDARTGSIGPGKDADLLLLSGDPLDLTSRVLAVISGGKVAFEAKSR
jgi:imidazolonepropionase-like amidohydrolase